MRSQTWANLSIFDFPITNFLLSCQPLDSYNAFRYCCAHPIPYIVLILSAQVLDISSNLLVSFPEGILSQLQSLQTLNVNFCLLESLPEDLGSCTSLVSLEVQDNCLEHLPNLIGNLTSLAALDLGQNNLQTLPDSMRCLGNLQELQLNNNKLSFSSTTALTSLAKLKYLDLSFNQIGSLPNDLERLSSLNHLNLSNNSLEVLPSSICSLSSLVVLKLSHNRLSALPDHIGDHLQNLTELALDSNRLNHLPKSLARAENLEYLDVHANLISELSSDFGQMTKLAILNMRNNLLCGLPSDLGLAASLRVLDISDNKLCSLPTSFANLRLSALWLASNQARPLVPLTLSWDEDGPQLTCYLLPQAAAWTVSSQPEKERGFPRQVSFCCKDERYDEEGEEEEKFTAKSAEVLPKTKTKCRAPHCSFPKPPSPTKRAVVDRPTEEIKSKTTQEQGKNTGGPLRRSAPQSPIMRIVQSRIARIFHPHNYDGLSPSSDCFL